MASCSGAACHDLHQTTQSGERSRVSSPFEQLVRKVVVFLEKLVFLLLCGVSLHYHRKLFLYSYGVGIIAGFCLYSKGQKTYLDSMLSSNKTVSSGCTQSFAEQAMGRPLPIVFAAGAAAAAAYYHTLHHPEAFVPIFGVLSGLFLGELLAAMANIDMGASLKKKLPSSIKSFFLHSCT